MLELDPRIKDRSVIKTVLEANKSFIGKVGYFADFLYELSDLSDLSKCHHGKITGIDESGKTDYCFKFDYYGEPSDSMLFIADEDLLPPAEEYRPFKSQEFVNKFDVGKIVCFRHKIRKEMDKVAYPPSVRALVTSIEYYKDPTIRIGDCWYSLERLFEDYELYDKALGWIPFGVKVHG